MPKPQQPKLSEVMTRSMPVRERREVSVIPKSFNKDDLTVELTWSVGARVLRSTWWGEQYYEELDMAPESIRMERLKSGKAPYLDTHDLSSVSKILGVIIEATIADVEARAKIRFSRREEVKPVIQDVADGIICNNSFGYTVYKYRDVTPPNEVESGIPTYRAIDWEPFEISAVPVGADPDAGFRSPTTTEHPCEKTTKRAESAEKGDPMPPEIENSNPAPVANAVPAATVARATEGTPIDSKKIQEEATKLERERQTEIRSMARKHNLGEEFADKLVVEGVSVAAASRSILDELHTRSAAAKISNVANVSVTRDGADSRREGMAEALLHRSAPDKYTLTEKGRTFRSMSLLRMAEEIIGPSARLLNKSELATRALSTSDFAETLANVAGKRLRDSYAVQPQTFKPLVRLAVLPDYKQVSRVQFGDASDLQPVNEDGEYELGSIGEGAEKYSLAKYGKRIRITEETIINDDLDAFSRVPALFGGASARLESRLFWDIFLSNPNMSDSVALFHATHGNLGSAAAITDASLSAGKAAMRKQKTTDGADFLDLQPSFLICGPDKETEARKMLSAQLLATKTGDVNVWSNGLAPIVESRITGNLWFLSASSDQIDLIEMGTLDGMAGPQMSTRQIFESDAIEIKCKHVVAFKAIDYRGLYKNPGA